MPTRYRLDAELVRRKIARSREHARELIAAGRVHLRGIPATKAATSVTGDDSIRLVGDVDDFVSRGAHKLIGALDAFEVDPAGMRVLDAGRLHRRLHRRAPAARRGAGLRRRRRLRPARLEAPDRRRAWSSTTAPTFATSPPSSSAARSDLTVGDLSFISLALVLPALAACAKPGGMMLPMVKPQFEVGKGQVGSGGVVGDPAQRADAVWGVIEKGQELGWTTTAVAASPLPGPKGNVEFFCRMEHGDVEVIERDAVDAIVAAGPAAA